MAFVCLALNVWSSPLNSLEALEVDKKEDSNHEDDQVVESGTF